MNNCEKPLSPELDARLLEPYTYIIQHSGKQVRSKLIQAFNHWLQIPDDKLKTISSVVEMLHNSSLLIDDIEDNSTLRRGNPVAHNIYGIPSTINAANYVYFLALEKLMDGFPQESCSEGVRIFSDQLLQLHRGQGLDIYWRDAFICPTEEEYLDMIQRKTGGLFGLGVRLMQLFSEDKRDFSNLIKYVGTYFQIRDDYYNLKSKTYEENKSYCEDLTEGKFSFPIIHAIRNNPDDKSLINIIKQRTQNVELKKYAVSRMEEYGSFAYTHKVMNELCEKAFAEVEKLGGNPFLKSLLEYLKQQV